MGENPAAQKMKHKVSQGFTRKVSQGRAKSDSNYCVTQERSVSVTYVRDETEEKPLAVP